MSTYLELNIKEYKLGLISMLTFSRRKKKYKNMNHSKKTNINRSSLSQLNSLKMNEKQFIQSQFISKINRLNKINNDISRWLLVTAILCVSGIIGISITMFTF